MSKDKSKQARVQYAASAEADLVDIGEYTLQTWSEAQTTRYLSAIAKCCERLAENPMLGRACDEISPGLRRMRESHHEIFYRRHGAGIRVVRILHTSMLPNGRLGEDEPLSQ